MRSSLEVLPGVRVTGLTVSTDVGFKQVSSARRTEQEALASAIFRHESHIMESPLVKYSVHDQELPITPTIRRTAFFAATDLNDMKTSCVHTIEE